jgi:hypothetical protein
MWRGRIDDSQDGDEYAHRERSRWYIGACAMIWGWQMNFLLTEVVWSWKMFFSSLGNCSLVYQSKYDLENSLTKCKMVWKLSLNNSATLNSHTDASRCSQIGWMQCNALSGAPRLLLWCSSMLWKLWNRIQKYPEECIVVFKMLQNQPIRMCKCWSFWEDWKYLPCLQDYSSAPRTRRQTLLVWLL